MSAAEHTGKLVLDIPHAGRSSVVVPPEQAQVFRRDGAYIITGGLGGLGLFLAEKMAGGRLRAHRAHLALAAEPKGAGDDRTRSGRSEPTSWWSAATSPSPAPRERLVAAATATGLPLRGVLHAAAVVEDATLANITDELIERDWAPKVYGAWNLHQATADAAAGLVLLVLLGGRAGGLARPGRLCRGQQLAGRVHPLAPSQGLRPPRSPGARGPRSAAAHGLAESGDSDDDRSRGGRLRVRGAAAPRPRLHRLRADDRMHRG